MQNATILILVGKHFDESDLARRLEALRTIAAHAVVFIVGERPPFPYYALGVPMYGTTVIPPEWQDEITANEAALKEKADQVEQLLARHDVSGEVTTLACEVGQVSAAIARAAMVCDMAVIGDDLREPTPFFRQVTNGVLFDSPIGFILNDKAPSTALAPETVFVAWNTELNAARAVHQTLPLMRSAKEVIVGIFDPVMTEYGDGEEPGADLAKWLTHHGCTVTVRQFPSGGHEIGEAILEHSKECGADLVVMGAYGHSRAREAILGGTTRTMVEQTGQAVFMAH
ncbi:hypothetical protein A8B78_02795 [Jannaschia sp. EhC01]|nr:hypothetical protein A8B78_02795 [Jannaschia sp. EhC01]